MDWAVSILVYSTVGIPLLAVFYINRKAIHARLKKHIGVFLIAVGMIYLAAMTFLFLYPPINSVFGYSYFPDFIRNLILGIGGLGGFYGLVLAHRRGKTFDKQVADQEKQIGAFADQVQTLSRQVQTQEIQADTAQEQLFNERLSRGIEQLGKGDNVTMRRAGVRLLDELVKSTNDEKSRTMVISILHDYIVESARKRDEGEDNYIPRHERMDIELAVELVVNLAKEAGLGMHNIKFDSLDLSGLNFDRKNLEGGCFQYANLNKARFYHSEMSGADFFEADLSSANFLCAQLFDVDFAFARLEDTGFFEANLSHSNFRYSHLEKTRFSMSDCTGADFTDAEDWSPEQFKEIVFEESNPPKLPEGMKPPENRAYKIVKKGDEEIKVFVHSGKLVEEEF